MKPISFLTEEEIQKLQESKPFIRQGKISLFQRLLDQGRPLLWPSAFWIS